METSEFSDHLNRVFGFVRRVSRAKNRNFLAGFYVRPKVFAAARTEKNRRSMKIPRGEKNSQTRLIVIDDRIRRFQNDVRAS